MRVAILIFVVGMLLSGSINTLTKKAQNDSNAVGMDGTKRPFEHPWFQTLLMFVGEFLCLFGLFGQYCKEDWQLRRKQASGYEPITFLGPEEDPSDLKQKPQPPKKPRIFQWILLLPTCFDLLGTTFAGIGLLWTLASVWQMLRGSIIVFTGILSIIFLKRKLYAYNWIGMAIVVIGLILVGVSSVLNETGNGDIKMILGIVLILVSQLCNAAQVVVEETFVKGRGLPPLQIVGMEGFFGIVLMVCLVMPICFLIPGSQPSYFEFGSYDNSVDALVQIVNDYLLLGMTILYLFSIAFYNFFGLAVTKSLTAVHRTLIDSCRTLLVWGCGIFIHYAFRTHFGEKWNDYSPLQLAGFFLLILGTVIYNKVLKIPFLYYDTPATTDQKTVKEDKKTSSDSHAPVASIGSINISLQEEQGPQPKLENEGEA